MGQLLTELSDSNIQRSKSARKLADYVLANPAQVIEMPIAKLAIEVGVSEPTVNRFCTGLGTKGFPAFKLKLAAELARRDIHITQDIESGDSCSKVMVKIFDSAHASLQATLAGLEPATIDAVVDVLYQTRSITICGQGASSSVALDAQHKFLRFGTPVSAPQDNINQRITAARLSADDCLICISYTGRTIPIIDIAKIGRDSGATVVGITTTNSSLAKLSHYTLPVDARENTDLYTPMTSRLSQLAVIDVVTSRLAMKQGSDFTKQLQWVKHSLADTRAGRSKPGTQ